MVRQVEFAGGMLAVLVVGGGRGGDTAAKMRRLAGLFLLSLHTANSVTSIHGL